jgi:hypothetical protein
MSSKFVVMVVAALLVAAPMAVFAEGSSGDAPRFPARPHTALARHRLADMRATHSKRPAAFISVEPHLSLHSVYEREGLTRNPDDCVVYGCLGNN